MSEVSLAKLAKEAVELKKKFDELAQKVNDLDVFMREAVMAVSYTHLTLPTTERV